jgi:hypothetical protein
MQQIRSWIRILALVVLVNFAVKIHAGVGSQVIAIGPALVGSVVGLCFCWTDARQFRQRRWLAIAISYFAFTLALSVLFLSFVGGNAQLFLHLAMALIVIGMARWAWKRSRVEVSPSRMSRASAR